MRPNAAIRWLETELPQGQGVGKGAEWRGHGLDLRGWGAIRSPESILGNTAQAQSVHADVREFNTPVDNIRDIN